MLRCVRIHTDNSILEKTLDTRGGPDQLRLQVAHLLQGLDLYVEASALNLDDDWERGHIRFQVAGEVSLEKLGRREGVVVLSVRNTFNPGPLAAPAAAPVVPPAKAKASV